MESITETPGGCQTVCGISHDIQEVFEGYATDGHRTFIRMLQVIEQFLPAYDRPDRSVGRKAYDGSSMVRPRLAEQFFQISTVTPLRNRLPGGPSRRQICGFFSRVSQRGHLQQEICTPCPAKAHGEDARAIGAVASGLVTSSDTVARIPRQSWQAKEGKHPQVNEAIFSWETTWPNGGTGRRRVDRPVRLERQALRPGRQQSEGPQVAHGCHRQRHSRQHRRHRTGHKISHCLMTGVPCLAVINILRCRILPRGRGRAYNGTKPTGLHLSIHEFGRFFRRRKPITLFGTPDHRQWYRSMDSDSR